MGLDLMSYKNLKISRTDLKPKLGMESILKTQPKIFGPNPTHAFKWPNRTDMQHGKFITEHLCENRIADT